jgi:3-hydroxymyristoyl/3-hydroxydecanoyl-(acyl carrier protein) dehydratase
VVPGDQLRLTAQILKLKNRICHLAGQASVDGEVAVEGELMAMLLTLEEMNGRT